MSLVGRAVALLLLALATTAPVASEQAEGFDALAPVFLHPRCTNCHAGGDRPWWTDRAHGFNVRGGEDRRGAPGQRCISCHSFRNPNVENAPPGVRGWALAPHEAGWRGLDAAEVCTQLKDPARTDGKDLEAVAKHLETDALVIWAWAPGPGREPAPGTHAAFVESFRTWMAAGADCP